MAHGRTGQQRMGLRRDPPEGWPLDALLVGVGTLRTLRELYRQFDRPCPEPLRAWDIALWSGVTPQGSIKAMDRIHRAGLVSVHPPDRPWRAVRYRLEPAHPLVDPLGRLFEIERSASRKSPSAFGTPSGTPSGTPAGTPAGTPSGRSSSAGTRPLEGERPSRGGEDVTGSSAPAAPRYPAGEPGTGPGR